MFTAGVDLQNSARIWACVTLNKALGTAAVVHCFHSGFLTLFGLKDLQETDKGVTLALCTESSSCGKSPHHSRKKKNHAERLRFEDRWF